MDRIKKYEAAILSILNEYSKIKYANINGENQIIADKESHRYQVVTIGWEDNMFIHIRYCYRFFKPFNKSLF